VRIAWFSPLPPVRSGIAAYTAELIPLLAHDFHIDVIDLPRAHDFVWAHRQRPYDLVVYQLGNAPWHEYMWAYLAAFPGLVVMHDARLHHARARHLMQVQRVEDYRREFRYNHPDAPPAAADYAVEGLRGSIYYFWPMRALVLRTARLVAVHNARVAAELTAEEPAVAIESIRMGVPAMPPRAPGGRAELRQSLGVPDEAVLFTVFGKVTAEKRIEPVMRALGAIVASGINAHLLVVGDEAPGASAVAAVPNLALGARTHTAGYVPDDRIGDYLAASDVCVCLRWPTAQETSASWLRAIAAGRPTVITALAHLADIPSLDAGTWRRSRHDAAPVAVSIDLLDEDAALVEALRRLATDAALRDEIGREAFAYWNRHHRLEHMADDYRRVLRLAASRPVPRPPDLPAHVTDDRGDTLRAIAHEMGVDLPW